MNSSISKILNFLFIGNKKGADLYGNNYEMVVNCTPDLPNPNVNCIRLSVKDDPYQASYMYQLILENNVLEKIHSVISNNKNVLVFCGQGQQRSCCVVACYLVKYHNMSPLEAITYIKKCRPEAFFCKVNFIDTIKMFHKKIDFINESH